MADLVVFYVYIGRDVVVLFIHVDSMMTGSSSVLNKMFMKQIAEHFEITDLGPISWLLLEKQI